MLLAGGKRFRPMLLLSVVKALEPRMLDNAFPIAYAIECTHTYSLIHDDLPAMDNADLRRGVPTLHKRYDEVTAILVGDALNTASFEFIANAPLSDSVKIKLVRLLAQNSCGMVLGQAIDCKFEKSQLNLEELKILHLNKTARLIGASLAMGAVIANSNLEDELYAYGLILGELFQIRDDILDVTQDETTSGKTAGRDEFKNSFVTLLGLDEAKKAFNESVKLSQEKLSTFPQELQNILTPNLTQYFTI
ncbi:MAG: geranyl diphosphate synthase / farnesyl diphosphate synthase [Pseudomonadota bacterium]|jgi:farnesyl diphosphate synthase